MSARHCLLLTFAVVLTPFQAAARQDPIVTRDAFHQPSPPPRGSVVARGPPREAARDAEAVVIRRRCGPVREDEFKSSGPTGEVHAGASTAGEQQVGATVCLPLGRRGDAVIGVEALKVDPSQAPRRPGWP